MNLGALDRDINRELDGVALEGASQRRFTQLAAVMTGHLPAFLLARHRRRPATCGAFDLERPGSGHVDFGFAALAGGSRAGRPPGRPLALVAAAKIHRPFHRVAVSGPVHRDTDRAVLCAHAEPDRDSLLLHAGLNALVPLRARKGTDDLIAVLLQHKR